MLFQGGQLFYITIVIVRSLRRRRTDILNVGESTLDVGEQTVGETTVIRFNDKNHKWKVKESKQWTRSRK